ncbi:hypothetical protein ACFU5Y_00545 [Streptomyces gardneri]|uniref:hypothetical protein n=1 Tax=Streptomyces gardneri TaxID=66892 RepID=UPI0036C2BD00
MITMKFGSRQRQPAPQLSILATSFDGFLAQAEHELCCRRREVRALRQRARRQRRRELGALRQSICFVGRSSRVVLTVAGAVTFLVGMILLLLGNFDTAKDSLALSAAVWGATQVWPRCCHRNEPLGDPHDGCATSSPASGAH